MKYKLNLLLLVFLFLAACSFELPFHNHEFRLKYSFRLQNEVNQLEFYDLRADGQELIIQSFSQMKGSAILISDLHGKSISQFSNASGKFTSPQVLTDPRNQKRFLIYSVNEGNRVYLQATYYDWETPRRRYSRVFQAYPRNDELMNYPDYDWGASLNALYLEDIDNDGKLELVAAAFDSYSANPRGLMVFDFESGRLKWFFQSPTCFTSVVLGDFDGDGKQEFLLGNRSFKNTDRVMNNLDDYNGYIAIVDTDGNLQYTERLIDGISEVKLQTVDTDQDGIPEIYALLINRGTESTGNAILRLRYDGKRLIRLDELSFPGHMEAISPEKFMFRLDKRAEYKMLINNQQKGLELYDSNLNLIRTGRKGISMILETGDFLHKGQKSLLAQDKDDNYLLLDRNLRTFARLENPFPGSTKTKVRLLQQDSSQKPLLAIASEKTVSFYEITHISLLLYIYRLLKSYSIWLSLILLAFLIHVVVLILQRKRVISALTYRSGTGYLISNRKCRVLYANEFMQNLLQKQEPKAETNNLKQCLPQLCEIVQTLIKTKVDFESDSLMIKDERYHISVRSLPGHSRRYLFILTQPAKELDAETLQWAETARRLSHHVRRHITNVLLALDPLDAACPEKEKEYLEIVRSEIDKIRVFTHAFQRFTELRDYELKPYDIVPHVEHVLKQAHLAPNIKLIKNFSLKSIHSYIEPVRFEEALLNLINNASEAMPEGGSLHVSLRVFAKHKSPQGLLNVLVEVEDSGNGIPAKYLDDIWKPFFTTNQSGTGIGIPESRKIMDSMGGILDIQSEEGVGTVASMWIKGAEDA